MKSALLVSGCFLLFQPMHGLVLVPRQAMSINRSKQAVSYAARRHRLPRDRRGVGPAAFASPSRQFFTPKEVANDDKPFIRPALHNSNVFRLVAILYALLFAIYQGSAAAPGASTNAFLNSMGRYLVLPPSAAATVHLLSFSIWFGTVVYTTFVAGITMFKNLPRRVFGTLQSKLFPLYFRLCSVMIGVQVRAFRRDAVCEREIIFACLRIP
jgi:hypothetical protein